MKELDETKEDEVDGYSDAGQALVSVDEDGKFVFSELQIQLTLSRLIPQKVIENQSDDFLQYLEENYDQPGKHAHRKQNEAIDHVEESIQYQH